MIEADRIKKALVKRGIPRGHRGPDGEHHFVELAAGDVVACAAVAAPSETVEALHKGSNRGNRRHRVNIQVDDAFHLLDQVDAATAAARAPAPVPATPGAAAAPPVPAAPEPPATPPAAEVLAVAPDVTPTAETPRAA